MKTRTFFTLWRCCLIAMLGLAIQQLYGFQPAPLLILALIGLAVDSVASLFLFKE
jgi:hypothetical protein